MNPIYSTERNSLLGLYHEEDSSGLTQVQHSAVKAAGAKVQTWGPREPLSLRTEKLSPELILFSLFFFSVCLPSEWRRRTQEMVCVPLDHSDLRPHGFF